MLNYRSYPKIKLGIRFWTTLYVKAGTQYTVSQKVASVIF